MNVGVVIGHYNRPEAIELNVAAIRYHCGDDISIMVSDDCSDGFENKDGVYGELERLSKIYDFYLWPNLCRVGHCGGDLTSFWKGVTWGGTARMDVVFKLSQRFVFDTPCWAQEWACRLMDSPLSTLGRDCKSWSWGIRTEAVGMKIADWNNPKLMMDLYPRKIGYPIENYLTTILRDYFHGQVMLWDALSPGRAMKKDGYLFREANSEKEYELLASKVGVKLSKTITCEESKKMKNYILG